VTGGAWTALPGGAAVAVLRGDAVESVHGVAACVTGPDGSPLLETGSGVCRLPVFPRSAAKPLQALPSVRAGVLDELGLGEAHLAVACASHSGGPEPVRLVEELLAAAGLPEEALGCGLLPPLDAGAAAALVELGEAVRPVHHNCSGNHALGLALCAHHGWPLPGYLDPDHPLQQAMRETVAAATGGLAAPEGVDGCGMRAYRLPLAGLAAAYGRLAAGRLGDEGARVAAAMRAHPEVIWGAGGIDTALMTDVSGAVAKLGAESVLAVGLDDGRGLALKVLDGARRALEPAGVAAVRSGLGVEAAGAALERLARPEVRTASGVPAGRLEASVAFGRVV
jgi:L-asparaginase II